MHTSPFGSCFLLPLPAFTCALHFSAGRTGEQHDLLPEFDVEIMPGMAPSAAPSFSLPGILFCLFTNAIRGLYNQQSHSELLSDYLYSFSSSICQIRSWFSAAFASCCTMTESAVCVWERFFFYGKDSERALGILHFLTSVSRRLLSHAEDTQREGQSCKFIKEKNSKRCKKPQKQRKKNQ